MSDTTLPWLRPLLLCLAGTAAGFGVTASAFWFPVGWGLAALLFAVLCWLMVRLEDQGGKLWIAVGIGAAVGVVLYFGLALVQNLFADPSSSSGSGSALINGPLLYL